MSHSGDQRELVYTAKTIKQLAAALGFNDEAYFTRFFHKHVGVSPTQFRELAVRKIVLSETIPDVSATDGLKSGFADAEGSQPIALA
ncbi:helix-turn-helix domain-containing protein [Prodigiosinella aquatilis]|nr:helix-turn-helix domain-containing protein [Prodigiosinella sp. LS101]WJV52373.1 helix-turn-helix domain-containing protein [Prodigiosinella sp. LS101]WJV56727.1 helix-turn-helix domain-containing protein [Pectobacteriaceae bacterium C111]